MLGDEQRKINQFQWMIQGSDTVLLFLLCCKVKTSINDSALGLYYWRLEKRNRGLRDFEMLMCLNFLLCRELKMLTKHSASSEYSIRDLQNRELSGLQILIGSDSFLCSILQGELRFPDVGWFRLF